MQKRNLYMHPYLSKIFSCILLFVVICLKANSQSDTSDADAAFKTARELAFAGKREESRKILFALIERFPKYTEIRSFAARTYAWEGNYDKARDLFQQVQNSDPRILENYTAWSDMERWDNKFARSLEIAEQGLVQFNNNNELLVRKAWIYSKTGRLADAKSITQKILRSDRHHRQAYILLQELRSELLYNGIGIGYSRGNFSRYYDVQQSAFVQGSRITKNGSVILRLNYANRFDQKELQPEVELYPKIYKSVYGYLGYAFSTGKLFPEQRFGAEIFSPIPGGFEASLGYRNLKFNTTSNIYTASIGYYFDNYWSSFRAYITPGDGTTSKSFSFTLRRYFKSPEEFLNIRIGTGLSPENDKMTTNLITLHAQSIAVGYQHLFSKNLMALVNIEMGRNEPLFDPGNYISSFQFGLTGKYRFR